MRQYELTPSAQEDLKEIARYTLTKWGEKQSLHYAELLDAGFRKIAAKNVNFRTFSKRFPQILVSRCEYHYIFYVHPDNKPPRIIAVLHERMDMLARLKNRLD
ncbi:MAG: type II toxin-antitoxin system RelE/ParE family toxin [Methylococcaceae bacterium]